MHRSTSSMPVRSPTPCRRGRAVPPTPSPLRRRHRYPQGVGSVEFQTGPATPTSSETAARPARGRCSTRRRPAYAAARSAPSLTTAFDQRRALSAAGRTRGHFRGGPDVGARWAKASLAAASHRLGAHPRRLARARAPRGRRLCRRVVVRHPDRAGLARSSTRDRPVSRSRSTACREDRRRTPPRSGQAGTRSSCARAPPRGSSPSKSPPASRPSSASRGARRSSPARRASPRRPTARTSSSTVSRRAGRR